MFLVWVFLSAWSGCGKNPSTPDLVPTAAPAPTATPSPNYPLGTPNATAFENLPLIRSLETASGRQTILVSLGGSGLDQDGRLLSGDGWQYVFAERAGNVVNLYEWTLRSTGALELTGPYSPFNNRVDFTEIGPVLAVDSDEAVRLGRRYGAQPFVDKYPNAHVTMTCRFQGRLPTWEMKFWDHSPTGTRCELGPIYVNAQTGDLLARELSCLNQ